MTDEQIEKALNTCTFGQTKVDRCKDCPLDSEKEPCITNLHLAALEYIRRLKHRAEVAERALKDIAYQQENLTIKVNGRIWSKEEIYKQWIAQAEKELAEEEKE